MDRLGAGAREALQHERIAGVGSTTVIHLRTLQVLGNQMGSSGVLAVPAGYGVLSTGMAMRGLSVVMRPPSNGHQGNPTIQQMQLAICLPQAHKDFQEHVVSLMLHVIFFKLISCLSLHDFCRQRSSLHYDADHHATSLASVVAGQTHIHGKCSS